MVANAGWWPIRVAVCKRPRALQLHHWKPTRDGKQKRFPFYYSAQWVTGDHKYGTTYWFLWGHLRLTRGKSQPEEFASEDSTEFTPEYEAWVKRCEEIWGEP